MQRDRHAAQRERDGRAVPWRRALAWLVFLGPFFFLTYGFATWVTAQRADVPSIVFDWERALPFWAWTILPYWSIDLLYGLSLFVCSSRRELDTHAKRLLTAQVIAVALFLVVPLRFSFDQPAADGVWGAMFAALAQFDKPFNQLPSLHVALAVILWALYARKLSGLARVAMTTWFVLIGASVLTTYQHHFIDIPTGLLLGLLCMWLWPFADEGDGRSIAAHWRWTRDPDRRRFAAMYALAAIALAVLAFAGGGWALWLTWVAMSLTLVALAYAAIGAGAFQKGADGALSVASRWLFAPYRVGAWLNSRAWTFSDPRPVAVADGVYLGRVPTARELAASPVAGVVDLTAEFELHAARRALVVDPRARPCPARRRGPRPCGAGDRTAARARTGARVLRARRFAQRLRGCRVAARNRSGAGRRVGAFGSACLALARGPRCGTRGGIGEAPVPGRRMISFTLNDVFARLPCGVARAFIAARTRRES